ncbi:MAG: hypothetical protein HY675_08260 [Chloroflexi bacterium]|nr:hypothetical protein [Chloroflexota bacterium]
MKNRLTQGSSRLVIQVEVVVLLLAAVALTVMPLETVAALATVSTSAQQFTVQHRPVVALVGLISVGVCTWLMMALSCATQGHMMLAGEGEHDQDDGRTLRRAA